MKDRLLRALLLLIFLSPGSAPAATAAPEETDMDGVVLEELPPGSALERAGLRPGDLLLAWEREGSRGEIRTPFDWIWLKAEQAPRGTVRLRVERSGEEVSFEVPKGVWDARVRPRVAAGPWLHFEAGEALSKSGKGPEAQERLRSALAEATDAQTRVAVLEALGKSYELANEMARAEESYRSALAAGEAAWGESLAVARTLTRLGHILRLRNRLDDAEQLQNRGLEVQRRLAPDSLEVAETLNLLAAVAFARGDLEQTTDLSRRALAIQERWAPGSLALSRSLNLLAVTAVEHGRYDDATEWLQRALRIQERLAPGSPNLAATLSNLGLVARERGDLDAATDQLLRALEIWERFAPESVGICPILTNLGAIARERGDPAAAERHFRRVLAIFEKAAPGGIGAAGAHDSLGILARSQGRLDEAWSHHSRALEIREKLAPGSYDMAGGLKELGIVAGARGDLKTALDLLTRARDMLGRLTPGTTEEAQALQQLGRLHRRMNHLEEAARSFALAVEALESQTGRLGGSRDAQAAFRASHDEIYRDAIDFELERGNAAAAFHLVERSRARTFLALLAERDLALVGELPAELESSRRDNAARYDQTLSQLTRWNEKAGEKAREALHRELDRLRQERERIADEIRRASPRLSGLREPRPLGFEVARKFLDPGTLALSYSVGKERTALFAATRDGDLHAKVLPLGEERLRRAVESFLERVRAQERPANAADLYRELIGPVADLVEGSERVLILPDGPLHRLPFGALVRDTRDGQFLIEWKPMHTALSLTVYGTLRAASAAHGPAKLVAFGDPRFPEGMASRSDLAPGLRSFDWSSLPYSRSEVERIAGVHPGALLYLGEEATEERAKSIRDARILHFATHGYTDDRTPLDSALVLTIPEKLSAGQDNGLLQVWEIFERVRLDADLVVLSACESALGRELSGEGLIGLTRAFQYAGARSVAASLWSVADQVTAELMARFHGHLAAGLPKDEALRAAQIELIREPLRITTAKGQTIEMDASPPFFWAAFQLFGDWR